jgi:hypothetical protein
MGRMTSYVTEMDFPKIAAAMEVGTAISIGMESNAKKLAAAIIATGHQARIHPKDQMYSVYKVLPVERRRNAKRYDY